MNDRKEVLGGSNQKRSPRLGDRFICMIQYDESGELYMFYAILPERESSMSDLASYHALSTCCPLMRVRVLHPELNLKE